MVAAWNPPQGPTINCGVIQIKHIYVSEAHNFFGHHGQPPGKAPMVEVPEVNLVKNKGIAGDRFFDFKDNYKGQVTFFEYETFLDLRERFGIFDRGPESFRRNIITVGVDLNSLIGNEFEIQDIRFFGTEECRPCYWMETAFCEGAEESLRGKGGLRARILSSGKLGVTKSR